MKRLLLGVRALMSVPKDNPGLIKAQYLALSRQLPMMYFILLTNTLMLAGTHYAVAPRWLVLYCPLIMTLFGVARAAEWFRTRNQPRSPTQMLTALKRTNRLAPFVASAFTAWALALFPYGDSYTQAHVGFYMAITVIGCIFCMMHLLPAALVTTAVVNTAFVVFFASTTISTFVATAIDVLLVSIAMLVILKAQYGDFTRLVNMQAQTAKLSEENLKLANQDSLTGLANRRQFFSRLDTLLADARAQGTRLAVGLIDLDGFKPVNDLYGHSVGDRLLCQVGQRLSTLLGEDVHLARLGGDEFSLIITGVLNDEQLRAFGERVCASLREPFLLVDLPIQISGSLASPPFPTRPFPPRTPMSMPTTPCTRASGTAPARPACSAPPIASNSTAKASPNRPCAGLTSSASSTWSSSPSWTSAASRPWLSRPWPAGKAQSWATSRRVISSPPPSALAWSIASPFRC